jgi:iron complex outermembrane receptor protein
MRNKTMTALRKSALASTLLSLSATIVSLSTQAQIALEEVIVTAQKKTENLQQVPISINAFTEESLTTHRLNSVADIGPYVPGLITAPAAGVSSGARIWIRGIGTGQVGIGVDPRVALYTDGIYLGKTPGLAFDAVELERIEVLKGPQGTLYGRNAVGGAINLISKKANLVSTGGELKLGTGNFDLEELRGTVNVPLGDSFAVKLSGMTKSRDGWVTNDGPGPDFFGYERDAVRVDMRWEVSDSLVVDYAYENNESELQPLFSQSVLSVGELSGLGALINPPTTNDRLERVSTAYALENSHLKLDAHSLWADWDYAEEHSLRLIASYREADATDSRGFWPESDGSLLPWTDRFVSNYGQSPVLDDHEQYSIELNFEGTVTDRVEYTTGLFYLYEDTGAGSDHTLSRDVVDFFNSNARQSLGRIETHAYAVFATLNWNPALWDNRLLVTIGGRYSKDKREGRLKTFANQGPLPDLSAMVFSYDQITGLPYSDIDDSSTWSNFDPQFILRYDLTDTSNVYASYATAFRSGGYNTGATTPAGFTFDTEDLEAIELGYKGDLMNGRLRLNMALFYFEQNGIQVTEQDPADPARANVFNTDGESKGFELELSSQLTEELTASVGYAYIDAKQDGYEAVFRPGAQDETTVVNEGGSAGAPENSIFTSINYAKNLGWGSLLANLNYSYTQEHDVTLGTEKSSASLLGARVTARWHTGESGELSLAVWGKNLLDDEDEQDRINFSTIDGFNAPDVVWFGEPRTYGVDLTYEF